MWCTWKSKSVRHLRRQLHTELGPTTAQHGEHCFKWSVINSKKTWKIDENTSENGRFENFGLDRQCPGHMDFDLGRTCSQMGPSCGQVAPCGRKLEPIGPSWAELEAFLAEVDEAVPVWQICPYPSLLNYHTSAPLVRADLYRICLHERVVGPTTYIQHHVTDMNEHDIQRWVIFSGREDRFSIHRFSIHRLHVKLGQVDMAKNTEHLAALWSQSLGQRRGKFNARATKKNMMGNRAKVSSALDIPTK